MNKAEAGNNQEKYGFRNKLSSPHTSRTIMIKEMEKVLVFLDDPMVSHKNYRDAVINENCLLKKSMKNRLITFRELRTLYGLDKDILIFRVLLRLYAVEPSSLPLLLFLCAYCRDSLLRQFTPFMLRHSEGDIISYEDLERDIMSIHPDRFSRISIKAIAARLCSSWKQAGYLQGKSPTIRTKPLIYMEPLVYSLFLGYLKGLRGLSLFETEFTDILDISRNKMISLAESASLSGIINMKRIEDIVDIDFDHLADENNGER